MTLILSTARVRSRYRGRVTPIQRFKLRLAVVIFNTAVWSIIIWGLRQCLS